jgi:hypothetical protein
MAGVAAQRRPWLQLVPAAPKATLAGPPAMASFLEQFREFLAPRFQLDRELGSGGMGTVYLAHDTALHRAVAVKTLLPENASAQAARRFLREARTLAELGHPNIVRIYDVGRETDPFFYYVMEHLDGETLATRLQRGPLPVSECLSIGRDLLNALRAAHRRGVIHRDVKPANIFLVDGRGVLVDFGIAKTLSDSGSDGTQPGQVVGTRRYMAPEQLAGREYPQTDFYQVGMVLYEAVTGRYWDETDVELAGAPVELRPALRRALAWSWQDRWPDAASFQRALWRRRSRLPLSFPWYAGAAALLTVVIWVWFHRGPRVDVRIDRFRTSGVPAALGDSLGLSIAERLTGFPDFTVAGPGPKHRANAIATGSVSALGAGLVFRLQLPGQPPVSLATVDTAWRTAADLLADSVLVRLYSASPLDLQLPVRVLPRDPAGLRPFLSAEKAFAHAWLDSAYVAYAEAAALDPSCAICAWRHAEVARFLALPPDTGDATHYRAQVDRFPPNYQTLIRAEMLPLLPRLDSLDALARRSPDFLFGPLRLGDELLHRGPLVGQPRLRASRPFARATEIRRDFAPAWEHLAWLWIAEGNEPSARSALDTLRALGPPGRASGAMRDLLQAAFAWRFRAPADAAKLTASIVGAAAGRSNEPFDAGARYLNHFAAPEGAVWLGEQLEARDYHRPSAMLAQVFGHLSAGRPERARSTLARIHAEYGDPDLDLLGLELDAVLRMFAPDSGAPAWQALTGRLHEFASRAPSSLRSRADWMAALLARRFGGDRPVLAAPAPPPLANLLLAYDAAVEGRYTEALARSEPLTAIPAAWVGDPCFRTVLHFLRAEWQERLGQPRLADLELLWYESSDGISLPVGDPQPMEVDWAFATLGRWGRVRLSGWADCAQLREVVRLWARAEPSYAVRADSARQAEARTCGARRA